MSYCRLCAEPKSDDDLCASINDLKLNILEKLIVCCQWDAYSPNPELPEYICFLCSEKLEKSWLFSVCVSEAQRKLLQLLSDGELTFETKEAEDDEADLLDENLGDIFVEAIPVPQLKTNLGEEVIAEPDPVDELIGSTIEPTNDKIACDICKKAFTTTYNLTVHKRTHTNERPYVCWNENCDKQFKSSSNLNQHLRKVHGKPPYTPRPREIVAPEVIKKLVEKPNIDKVENSPEKEHFNEICDICGRKFRLKCTLKAHRTIHFAERKFECTLCHRAFKRMKLLRVHMRTHTQFPSIPCPISGCEKLFRRNCQKNAHITERHGVPAPPKQKKPPAPPKKPLKKFTCELCGLSFSQKGGLSTHMTVHSDNRPFKCDICNLGFKRKRTMQDHRKTHTHSHEYKCNQNGCEKAFRKKISLLRHLEYHSGNIIRPFICDFCGKGFRLNANLVEHQRIHTGEKPFLCEFKPCSQTFRTMSSFYSHLKKEHGVSVMARKLEQQARATALTHPQ